MWRRVLFICFILFCLELGLLLLVLPWSELWERNLLAALFPGLRDLLLSSYVRGAISGLGILNLWVGLSDAWSFRRHMEELDRSLAEEERAARAAHPPSVK